MTGRAIAYRVTALTGLTGIARARQLHDSLDQRRICKPALLRRSGEFTRLLEITVRVDLDDEDLTLLRDAKVYPAVVAQTKRVECLDRDTLHPLEQVRINAAREDRFCSRELGPAPLAIVAPLRRVAGDPRLVRRKLREIELDDRQRSSTLVPQHADIEFAPFHELLDEHGRLELLL